MNVSLLLSNRPPEPSRRARRLRLRRLPLSRLSSNSNRPQRRPRRRLTTRRSVLPNCGAKLKPLRAA